MKKNIIKCKNLPSGSENHEEGNVEVDLSSGKRRSSNKEKFSSTTGKGCKRGFLLGGQQRFSTEERNGVVCLCKEKRDMLGDSSLRKRNI